VSAALAWRSAADHYKVLAKERADEGTSVQLACLVLADYCVHRWVGDLGGPTEEMVALAENTAGVCLDDFVTQKQRLETRP
jgi:hypothetical protein